MKLVVGLGNPGKKYEGTRHNAGWRAVRAFRAMRIDKFDGWKKKFDAEISEGKVGGEKTILMLPRTYMNLSGSAVIQAARFWKAGPADMLMVYDDLDLPVGAVRVRKGGGAGGHNGVKSVLQRFATEDVPRIRIGIAGVHAKDVPAEDYVLQKFPPAEEEKMEDAARRAAEAIGLMLEDGIEAAMNRYNANE